MEFISTDVKMIDSLLQFIIDNNFESGRCRYIISKPQLQTYLNGDGFIGLYNKKLVSLTFYHDSFIFFVCIHRNLRDQDFLDRILKEAKQRIGTDNIVSTYGESSTTNVIQYSDLELTIKMDKLQKYGLINDDAKEIECNHFINPLVTPLITDYSVIVEKLSKKYTNIKTENIQAVKNLNYSYVRKVDNEILDFVCVVKSYIMLRKEKELLTVGYLTCFFTDNELDLMDYLIGKLKDHNFDYLIIRGFSDMNIDKLNKTYISHKKEAFIYVLQGNMENLPYLLLD